MSEDVGIEMQGREKNRLSSSGWGWLRTISRWTGVDRAIALSVLGRGWALIASPVSLLLIGTCLSPREQGYYYTFSSVLGLSVFFDLAFGGTIGLFASHERAQLSWAGDGSLAGDARPLGRMASLLTHGARWYGAVALLIVLVIVPVGLLFFGRGVGPMDQHLSWRWPWLWVGVATALSTLLTPVWAIHQAIGYVRETAEVRLTQQVGGSLILWLALYMGWRLYATPLVTTFAVVYGAWWLAHRRRPLLSGLIRNGSGQHSVGWRTEIWPLQWRIALSWFGVWFVFQTFAPMLLFRLQGPVPAGQMGMSLTVSQALSPLGAAWIYTKMPTMGTLAARREYQALDRLFRRALVQSTVLTVAGGASIVAAVWLLGAIRHPFADRLLPVGPVACLVGAAIGNHVVMALASYLRSHKREPLVGLSVAAGAATAIAMLLLARYGTAAGMSIAYLVVAGGLNVVATYVVFSRRRREWHGEHAEAGC